MTASKLPWPGAIIAALTAVGMLSAGSDPWLVAGVLLLWLGTLWLAHPEPLPEVGRRQSAELAGERMNSLIEPLGQPLLLLDGARIVIANAAARETLGAYILQQDVRVVLRHPGAVALLEREQGGSVTIQGLTSPRSIWQVARRPIGKRHAMVELINHTAEADISRAHTDFVANASHELSTPLSSIIGYVETLADGGGSIEPERAARFLEIVLREARRLQDLVQDLMSLSRVEAEKHDRPEQPLDLGELTASVVEDTAGRGDENRLRIELPEEPAVIAGDTIQLDQLIRNLIDNALKYGDRAQPVTVRVTTADQHVVLSVEDRGRGIDPEHVPHLTRRFYRTDPGRSRAGGTGLGLAIVKHIVERHHGDLDIASTVGEGTTVTVSFDAVQQNEPEQ